MVIGEAAAQLPRQFHDRHAEVEWRDIGFRNILVHAYLQVDWSIVWIAATLETAALRQQIAAIIGTEFGAS